jgi:hypothetical protein
VNIREPYGNVTGDSLMLGNPFKASFAYTNPVSESRTT